MRLSLSTCLVLVPLVLGAAPANAAGSTPDCSATGNTGFQAPATALGGTPEPANIDFVYMCDDPEQDMLTITAVTAAASGSAVVQSPDPTNGYDNDYVQYTPDEGFHGRDEFRATVTDGTTSTEATIYVHVVRPEDSVDCQATNNSTYKQGNESTDYFLNCFSHLAPPDDTISYTIDGVTPADETGNVVLHDVDQGDGTLVPALTFNDQIAAAQVTVQVTATDGSGATDTVFVILDNQHDPVCTTKDADGMVRLEQRSNVHTPLTQDLGCSDPDNTPVSYSTPDYYEPNPGDTAPGTLTISGAGVATFVPTDANWTGIGFWWVEVTDGNNGYNSGWVMVDRYQEADMSVAFSATPSTVTIGSSYTATMHVANAGPDDVTAVSIEVGVPPGSVPGALPVGCRAVNGTFLVCDYDTVTANADFTVSIPLTAGPGSVAGVSQIGAQYYGANFRNTNLDNPVTFADVTLVSAAVAPGAVVRGSAAGTTISTGAGNDSADAGAGDDVLLLGAGNDCGQGGAGDDTVHGNLGDDAVYGDDGPCVAGKASTSRFAAARAGNDRLYGDAGNDRLFGSAGADLLKGGPGTDVLAGGSGSDRLIGGSGRDRFVGGAGNDVIRARDNLRRERISCGAGRDVVYADKGDRVASNCEKVRRG